MQGSEEGMFFTGEGDKAMREGVTFPEGFLATGLHCGIKKNGKKDLALIFSTCPCHAAGTFTTNKAKAFSVLWSLKHITNPIRAILANSGNANALGGPEGWEITTSLMTRLSQELDISETNLLFASTGLIGTILPEETIAGAFSGMKKMLSPEGGSDVAEAIMTTDRFPKKISLTTSIPGKKGKVKIGGICKGAGMIHPNMATMLAFLTTDAVIDREALSKALKAAVSKSFNMITVDGDQSTNDTVICLANGLAKNAHIHPETPAYDTFSSALTELCVELASMIVRDGEGAKKEIEVRVSGAWNEKDARRVARRIAGSTLNKAAFAGEWPNWGRIAASAGMVCSRINMNTLSIAVCGMPVYSGGPLPYDEQGLRKRLKDKKIVVELDLAKGSASAVAWGCDLTPDYVTLNMEKE